VCLCIVNAETMDGNASRDESDPARLLLASWVASVRASASSVIHEALATVRADLMGIRRVGNSMTKGCRVALQMVRAMVLALVRLRLQGKRRGHTRTVLGMAAGIPQEGG